MKTKKVETAVVIGAGSGMGRAVAKKLSLDGIQVFLADLNLDSAEETLREIKEIDDRVEAFMVDVSRSASVAGLFINSSPVPPLDALSPISIITHAPAAIGVPAEGAVIVIISVVVLTSTPQSLAVAVAASVSSVKVPEQSPGVPSESSARSISV